MADAPLILPKGYGMRAFTLDELRRVEGYLFDALLLWEAPRKRGARRYVMSADVSDGLGQDRSVVEVIRLGTIEEPAEQVAEFASDQLPPMALAYLMQAIGQYYTDEDGIEAMAAIEINNHGLSTQDTLQLHLGYANFFTWEYMDARSPEERYSNKIGWVTTPRTRPMLLDKLYSALTTRDPITFQPDLLTHSALLHEELKDFQTEGALWEAEASRGAHDDAIMATAIGNYVTWRLQAGELEPMEERRRRRAEQQVNQQIAAGQQGTDRPDWRNSPITAQELNNYGSLWDDPDQVDEILFPW